MATKFIEGKHGHLFLDNDTNGVLSQTRGEHVLSADFINNMESYHKSIFEQCRRLDRRYVHIIVPNKETSLRVFLPDSTVYEQFGLTPVRQYLEASPVAKQFTFFNKDCLQRSLDGKPTYPLGDSHWTQRSALQYLYGAFSELGEEDVARRLAAIPLHCGTEWLLGDLATHAGKAAEEMIDILNIEDPKARINFAGSIVNEGYVRHYNSEHGCGKALILHDSFAHAAFHTLAEVFEETLFIHCPDYLPDVVASFSPDIVIRLQAERFFPRTPKFIESVYTWLKAVENIKCANATTSAYMRRYSVDRQHLYRILSVSEIPGVVKQSCLEPCMVPISRIEFGQKSPPLDTYYQDFPSGEWTTEEYGVLDGYLYTLTDAVVHGEAGIITCGDFLVRESLYHAFPEAWGMERVGDEYMYIPPFSVDINVVNAAHVMSGAGGSRNYGHWWANVIPAIRIKPFYDDFNNAILLMPSLAKPWQKSTLELIPEVNGQALFLGETTKVGCQRLQFVPRLLWSDYTPHPDRRSMFKEIRRRVGVGSDFGSRIFVSRADSDIRKLVNESELINIAAEYGFKDLTLSGLGVAEQIRIFSGAKYIISPHGAGLCNVCFCDPGTTLLELHKSLTVQWSIRRTCSAVGMRYGCLIGHEEEGQAGSDPHDYRWYLSPENFRRCLDAEVTGGHLSKIF